MAAGAFFVLMKTSLRVQTARLSLSLSFSMLILLGPHWNPSTLSLSPVYNSKKGNVLIPFSFANSLLFSHWISQNSTCGQLSVIFMNFGFVALQARHQPAK